MEIDKDTRIDVRIGAYGQKSMKILELFFKRCKAAEKKDWHASLRYGTVRGLINFAKLKRDTDGGIVLSYGPGVCDRYMWDIVDVYEDICPFAGCASQDDVKYRLGMMLAEITADQPDDPMLETYVAINGDKADSLHGAKVNEITLLAEHLMGDTSLETKYPQKLYKAVIGAARDPVQTEISAALAEEIDRIHKEFQDKRDEIDVDRSHKIYDVQRKMWEEQAKSERRFLDAKRDLNRKAKAERDELTKQERAAISALKKSLQPAK